MSSTHPNAHRRVVIVGPGRLGTALALRWVREGVEVVGFVGRNGLQDRSAKQACQQVAALEVGPPPSPLRLQDLDASMGSVWLTVSDGALRGAATAAAATAPTPGASGGWPQLWCHTSGLHGLDVLEPLGRTGSSVVLAALHPLCPVPDAATGARSLAGAPATLMVRASGVVHQDGDSRGDDGLDGRHLVRALATSVGLDVLDFEETHGAASRARYHAACALAANGGTALFALVEGLLESSGLGDLDAARRATAALLGGAVRLSTDTGPAQALSGPIPREDVETVESHVQSLAGDAALDAYRALMLHALAMHESTSREVDAAQIQRLRDELA